MLVGTNNIVKVADFGLARVVEGVYESTGKVLSDIRQYKVKI